MEIFTPSKIYEQESDLSQCRVVIDNVLIYTEQLFLMSCLNVTINKIKKLIDKKCLDL